MDEQQPPAEIVGHGGVRLPPLRGGDPVKSLVDAGFDPRSVIAALQADDMTLLKGGDGGE